MIPFVYDFFLFLMLLVLYRAGIGLKKNGGKILSISGLSAIFVYTLNEGLRYGRGIDYNLYGKVYEEISKGYDSNKEPIFEFVVKLFSSIGISYQGLVIFESFLFIIGSLLMLRHYKEFFPIALPLFALFSKGDVENMIRWYIGFSFILIGFSYLLNSKYIKFFFISYIGCFFHFGLIPLPLLFYAIFNIKNHMLHPFLSIIIFICIGLFFETEIMLAFSDLLNMLSFISEKGTEEYLNNADYWLTGGNNNRFSTAFPPTLMMLFDFIIVWYGYYVAKKINRCLLFPYNLFLIGFLIVPMARQIELLMRYEAPFYFFRAVICASILYYTFKRTLLKRTILTTVFVLLFFYISVRFFRAPFISNPKQFMYVWNRDKETYDSMLLLWSDEEDANSFTEEKKHK